MINDDFLNKILITANAKKKFGDVDMLIFQHKDSILTALRLNISIKSIYETIIKESDIKVSYQVVYRKIKKLEESMKNTDITPELQINESPIINESSKSDEPKIITSKQKKFTYNNEK